MTGFNMPLETFWRPVEFPEYVEKNLKNPQYDKTVGALQNLTEANFGQFLAPHIKNTLVN